MDIDDYKLLASEDDSESWQDEKCKFYFFLRWGIHIYVIFFIHLSVHLSFCPCIMHPISGTVHYLIIILGTHV